MIRRALPLCLILAALSAPAAAVGLGPLIAEGLTDGPKKAFYLNLMNPYAEAAEFSTETLNYNDDLPNGRIQVIPSTIRLGGGRTTRLLVIANDLAPGEQFKFRVCAERVAQTQGVAINARVCSKLSARRIG
jgi:hypothetical protein